VIDLQPHQWTARYGNRILIMPFCRLALCQHSVWDAAEYAVIAVATPRRVIETGVVPQCLVMADVLLSGWSDGRVLAHSSETGAPLWFIDNAHVGGVTALVMSHNKRFILTGKPQGSFIIVLNFNFPLGGPQGEVRLWELRSRDLVSHLKEHVARVSCLAIFDDDTMGVTTSRDRSILRWDLTSEVIKLKNEVTLRLSYWNICRGGCSAMLRGWVGSTALSSLRISRR
jgi:WD40 repeat protein